MLLAVFSAFIISFWAGKYVLGDKKDKTAYVRGEGIGGVHFFCSMTKPRRIRSQE